MTRRWLCPVLGVLLSTALLTQFAGPMHMRGSAAGALQCHVAPRSYADIAFLLETPPPATPPATTDGETLEPGSLPAATEREEMREVIEEWLACQNAGRLFSAWALFSDAYLYRLISRQPPITEELYDAWATPQPTKADTADLIEISGERRLSDGRLGAIVRISYTSIPMPKQFFFYFTEENGALLIDSILGEISFSVP